MSKGNITEDCFSCQYSSITLGAELWCVKMDKKCGPLARHYIHPDCPLPDWPTIKMSQINFNTYCPMRIQDFVDLMRSCGVDVVDDEKEG